MANHWQTTVAKSDAVGNHGGCQQQLLIDPINLWSSWLTNHFVIKINSSCSSWKVTHYNWLWVNYRTLFIDHWCFQVLGDLWVNARGKRQSAKPSRLIRIELIYPPGNWHERWSSTIWLRSICNLMEEVKSTICWSFADHLLLIIARLVCLFASEMIISDPETTNIGGTGPAPILSVSLLEPALQTCWWPANCMIYW